MNESTQQFLPAEALSRHDDEIYLIDLARIVWKRRRAVVSVFIVAVIITFVGLWFSPRTYSANWLLKIGTTAGQPIQTVDGVKAMLTSNEILSQIFYDSGWQGEIITSEIPKQFEIKAVPDQVDILQIVAKGRTGQEAEHMAGAVGENIIKQHQKLINDKINAYNEVINDAADKMTSLSEQLTVIDLRIASLQTEFNNRANSKLVAQALIAQSYSQQLVNAKQERVRTVIELETARKAYEKPLETTPTTPIDDPNYSVNAETWHPLLNLMLGILLGLILGVLYAFTAEWLVANKDQFTSIKK
ncbi:MAG: hypothetical protein V1763_00640 [Parcubacteria group bacterium]